MKNDYRKLLKVIRHSENQTSHIESIEAMVDMFIEKWKPHKDHPLYHKAHIRIEAELQCLKNLLNLENE